MSAYCRKSGSFGSFGVRESCQRRLWISSSAPLPLTIVKELLYSELSNCSANS